MKNRWLLLTFSICHVLIIVILFNSDLYDHSYNAAPLYVDYAARIMQGQVPYRDFGVEYPPVALLFFILPRLFTASLTGYAVLFTLEIVAFDIAGMCLIAALARRLKQPVAVSLWAYTLALLSIGPMVGLRYDLIPAIMVLAALYCLYHGKHKTGWAMLALGTMTKIYPAVIAPVFLIYYLVHRQYRSLVYGLATFAAVTLVSALPFLVLARSGFIDSFTYHTQRGLEMESSYASVLLFLHNMGLVPLYLSFGSGGWNVGGPLADRLAALSTPIMIVLLLIAYALFAGRERRVVWDNTEDPPATNVIGFSVLTVAIFMFAGKVLSPQFMVWLYPLVPVIAGCWRYAVWGTFMAIGLMTYYIFPTHYPQMLDFDQTVVDVLLWRNILLAVLGALVTMKATPFIRLRIPGIRLPGEKGDRHSGHSP